MFRISTLFAGLLCIPLVHAATFTVGTGGTYDNIQAAINASFDTKGSNEVRVGRDTYTENLTFLPFGSGQELTISGGWNILFDTQGDIPSIIDGDMLDSVLNIDMAMNDQLTLDNLRFQNGNANSGGGIDVSLGNNSSLAFTNCEIAGNVAEDDRTKGGGLDVYMDGDAIFSMLDSQIVNNQTNCSGNVDCRSGGMQLQALGNTQVTFSRNTVSNNSVTIATGSALTGGVVFLIVDSSDLTLEDNQFTGNSISGTDTSGGVGLSLSGNGTITARRNRIAANTAMISIPASAAQFGFSVYGDSNSVISDSVIVDSATKGMDANISGDGNPILHLVNLTVANHAGTGTQLSKLSANGTINLSNSISVDSSPNTQFGAGVNESDNLLMGSAGFVNAAVGNYDLTLGSPARNAGNNSPPGGLGTTDIAGNPRIFDITVDQGAYEVQSLGFFEDGYEDL